MKALKYLAITLTIVAVLATVVWFLRDTLIQRISGPLLSNYEVELVDVSLDALGTNNASISHLELVHANGTRIVIEGLTLPVRAGQNELRIYSAEKVSIVTTKGDDGTPIELAQLIDQFLSLTDTLPNNEFIIGEFILPPYPAIHDLKWTVTDSEQTLSGVVESVAISASINRTGELSYDVAFSLPGGSADKQDFIDGKLRQTDQGISIIGNPVLDLPGWEAITKMVGIVPEAIKIRSGLAGLQYDVDIPYDIAKSASVTAALTPISALQIAYLAEAGEATDVIVGKSSAIDINATFPEVDWTLHQDETSLLVTNGEWHDVPVSIGNLTCQTGPVCSMQAGISWPDAESPVGQVALIEMSSVLDVSFPDEDVRLDVRPGASLELTDLSSPDKAIGHLELHTVSATTMQFSDDGWSISADSIDASTESLSLADDLSINTPIFLENVVVTESDGVLSAQTGVFVPTVQAAMNEQAFALPGVKGKVSLDGEQAMFDLTTIDLHKNGMVEGQYDIDNEVGEISVDDIALTFDGAALSTRVAPWANDWDITAGNVALTAHVNWYSNDPDTDVGASASISLDELSGFYSDTAFAGLSTVIDAKYGGDEGFVVDPMTMNVALIDMGLPIENIAADVALDVKNLSADVENLRMTAFNGVISAEPFSFHTGRDVNNVTLHAKGIDLAELLAIKEFAAVDVTGTMTAVLPVTIAPDGISIDGGVLTGEAPGGVIRYLAGGSSDKPDTSAIGLATEALSNFEYESLNSNVTFNKDGNLVLQMRLKGRNPEMADSRPVILNLGVEDNVIQMLRSLQAARAVEEVLEKRLAE